MMKLISNLPIYLRYSACLLIFVAFTACGDDEAARGETVTGETTPTGETVTGETTPTAETLAAPGSSCSCDADCASSGSNTGLCLNSICLADADPIHTCDEEGTDTNCPTGFQCWGGLCWPNCDAFSCDGSCDSDGSCVPASDGACDSTCSRYCTAG